MSADFKTGDVAFLVVDEVYGGRAMMDDQGNWSLPNGHTVNPDDPTLLICKPLLVTEFGDMDAIDDMRVRATRDPAYRAGLLDAARIARAQGQDSSSPPCPSSMAAVYIDRVANGARP